MKPNLNYVLILPDAVEETTFIVPETVTVEFTKGTVIEVGDGAYNQRTGDFRPVQTLKGDRVYFTPNAGCYVSHEGLSCVLVREEEIFTRNGEPINEWIGIKFDENHNRSVNIGGIEVIRPNQWVHTELDNKTMYEVNRDLKDTNPQIATIVKGNTNYGLKEGDLVFTHYLAYNSTLLFDGIQYINFNSIFFKINGKDDFEMADGVILAKRVLIEAPKTQSGIFLTSDETKPEELKIKITHTPRDSTFHIGDTILTADSFHYEIDVYGEKYVKVTPEWIIGEVS